MGDFRKVEVAPAETVATAESGAQEGSLLKELDDALLKGDSFLCEAWSLYNAAKEKGHGLHKLYASVKGLPKIGGEVKNSIKYVVDVYLSTLLRVALDKVVTWGKFEEVKALSKPCKAGTLTERAHDLLVEGCAKVKEGDDVAKKGDVAIVAKKGDAGLEGDAERGGDDAAAGNTFCALIGQKKESLAKAEAAKTICPKANDSDPSKTVERDQLEGSLSNPIAEAAEETPE